MRSSAWILLSCALLCACKPKSEPATPPAPAASAPAASVPGSAPTATQAPAASASASGTATGMPDVGKLEYVSVSAKGMGKSPGAATNDALRSAIMQVNGTTIDASSETFSGYIEATATVDVDTAYGRDSAKATGELQAQGFADSVVSHSKGVVSSFRVKQVTPPAGPGQPYAVEIEASIAKYKAPADNGKVKIVVAPMRTTRTSFNIGGRQVPADQVLGTVRRQVIDALTQSGRFIVLDRDFGDEVFDELNMIESGQTANKDFAKLSQALSADLVWVGVVNELTYARHARALQTSDRELVSYSGSWSISQRLINVATRQIFESSTLQGTPPSIAPTTLQTGFNEDATVKGMEAEMVRQTVQAILLRIFPITVVERDGSNVVLSQGGQAVKEGGRYRVYLQGKEIKDPQTGLSLGNMDSVCCEVVVTRVTPNLSYGTLQNVQAAIDSVKPGQLQLRELLTGKESAAVKPGAEQPASAPAAAGAQRKGVASKNAQANAPTEPKAPAKDKDW